MARFTVQFETYTRTGGKSGVQGTTVTASTAIEAKNKVKASHAHSKIRIISCVKVGN